MSVTGIGMLRSVPEMVELLSESTFESNRPPAGALERAQKTASLAKQEAEEGFPVLHSFAVVDLWSLLEATIRTFVAEWIRETPDVFSEPFLLKLRVRLGEYETLESSEKPWYILNKVENEVGAGVRNGVRRFEALLEPFGFSGPVPDDLRKTLFELGQIRNAISHRGIVDGQLARACPWLGLSVGDDIKVSHEAFTRYSDASLRYVMLVVSRVQAHLDVDGSEKTEKWALRQTE
jgi:hypothetical protein